MARRFERFKIHIRYTSIQEKYKEFSNLKRWVLEPAIKEINKNTDIRIEYDVIRGGVKNLQIMEIEFKAKKKYKAQFPKEVFSKDQNNLEEVKVVKTITVNKTNNNKKGDENRNDNSCNRSNNFLNHTIDIAFDVGSKEQKKKKQLLKNKQREKNLLRKKRLRLKNINQILKHL